jgi:hypothetical protein
MKSVTSDLLRDLACWTERPCVSLYLPLDPKHPNIEAGRLGLKDLVADARHQLERTKLRRPAIDELLSPVEALLVADRWPLGSRGYGLFEAPGRSTHLQLDVGVPAIAVVGDNFIVSPLVGAVAKTDSFYLLAISQDRVRFYRGQQTGLVQVDVPELPASREEALRYEHHERQLGIHGGSHQGVDRVAGTLHGSPSERDLRKEQVRRFFRIVDLALWSVLHDQDVPLLVAGIEYELTMYGEVNRNSQLAAMVNTGSPERLSMGELHSKVWPTAAVVLDGPRRQLLERLASSTDALTSIPAILTACQEGRVAALFVRSDHLTWGSADTCAVQATRRPCDIELASVAIGAALRQGADIYPAATDELPAETLIAALPRY